MPEITRLMCSYVSTAHESFCLETALIKKGRILLETYQKQVRDVLTELNVQENIGLSKQQISASRKKYGVNQQDMPPKKSLGVKLLESLKEPMIIILLIAAGITIAVNIVKAMTGYETEFIECVGIIIAIALTITITLFMEGKSEKAFELLNKMKEDILVKVVREGEVQQISQRDLVVGDIMLLNTGDKLMADARLIEVYDLQVDESSLTGESQPIKKQINACSVGAVLAERTNMVYSGSFVTTGYGKAVITAVGKETEFGKVADALLAPHLENTPLQDKLARLGKFIAILGGSIAGLVFVLQLINMRNALDLATVLEIFISSIILIVAAVPEGLSTIVAASLAINVVKLSKENTLVKKITACETIGSVSVICSDKTGTLTENKMTVVEMVLANDEAEETLLKNVCINSTAVPKLTEGMQGYIGNPTECALLHYAYKKGRDYNQLRIKEDIVWVYPFSSETKCMSTIVQNDNEWCIYVKGSIEKILPRCRLGKEEVEHILKVIKSYEEKACRLIAFCHKPLDEETKVQEDNRDIIEQDMFYDGFAVIKDPLREESYASVQKCQSAGIAFKMLTGDNLITARAIADDLHIMGEGDEAVMASTLEEMSNEEFEKILPHVKVIARSTPLIKKRVVDTLKKQGHVVAVTGDGINDAPALKGADVGIAMGITGTEVSKEASDMILLDDSFATIVKAIEWGRGLYDNFRRFIKFQLTVNLSAVMVVVCSILMGLKAPFTALQLLWLNIVMDGPPALSLGLEPIHEDLMKREPVARGESIVTKTMLASIIRNGLIIAAICLMQQTINFLGATSEQQGTIIFTLFVLFQIVNAFNCRKLNYESSLKYGLKNKKMFLSLFVTLILQVIITQWGGMVFNTVPLEWTMWVKLILVALGIFVWDELITILYKIVNYKK